jgi:hypothetical protein
LLSIAVRAETFTAVSADDTYVAENYPDIVYPEEKIKIGFEDSGRNYGYIKFDMRIPKNVKILYANISLYHHDFRGTPPFSYEIYNLYSKFWNQETLTWKNQLCGEDTNNDYFCNLEPLDVKEVSYTGRYYEWNVTHAVLEEYKRGKNSISFALRIVGNYPGDNYSVFYNKESTASSRRPYMTIVYENNTNELSPDTKKYSVEETETNNNIPRNKYFRSFKKNIDYIKNNLYIRGVGAHGLPVSQDMNENYSLPRMVQSSAMSGSAVLYIITGNENYIAMSNDIADWLIHDQIEGYYRDIGEYGEINNLYGSVGVADRMLFLSTITHNITQQHSAERALN